MNTPQTPEQLARWLQNERQGIEASYPEDVAYPWPRMTSFGFFTPPLENALLTSPWADPKTRQATMDAYLELPEVERAAKCRWLYLIKVVRGGKVWAMVNRVEVEITVPAVKFAHALLKCAGEPEAPVGITRELIDAGQRVAALAHDPKDKLTLMQWLAAFAPQCFRGLIDQAWDGIAGWNEGQP